MGLCMPDHGRVSVELRRESFIVHADYAHDEVGNPAAGALAERWRGKPHPEFELRDIDDLIAALTEARDEAARAGR